MRLASAYAKFLHKFHAARSPHTARLRHWPDSPAPRAALGLSCAAARPTGCPVIAFCLPTVRFVRGTYSVRPPFSAGCWNRKALRFCPMDVRTSPAAGGVPRNPNKKSRRCFRLLFALFHLTALLLPICLLHRRSITVPPDRGDINPVAAVRTAPPKPVSRSCPCPFHV